MAKWPCRRGDVFMENFMGKLIHIQFTFLEKYFFPKNTKDFNNEK